MKEDETLPSFDLDCSPEFVRSPSTCDHAMHHVFPSYDPTVRSFENLFQPISIVLVRSLHHSPSDRDGGNDSDWYSVLLFYFPFGDFPLTFAYKIPLLLLIWGMNENWV